MRRRFADEAPHVATLPHLRCAALIFHAAGREDDADTVDFLHVLCGADDAFSLRHAE